MFLNFKNKKRGASDLCLFVKEFTFFSLTGIEKGLKRTL
jgi:hypothetical protein